MKLILLTEDLFSFGVWVKKISLTFSARSYNLLPTSPDVFSTSFSQFCNDFPNFFGLLSPKLHSSDEIVPPGVSKSTLSVRRKVLREYTSFGETCYVYSSSQTLSENFGSFQKSNMILNSLSLAVQRQFLRKSCFLLVFYKSFRILSGIVWSFE